MNRPMSTQVAGTTISASVDSNRSRTTATLWARPMHAPVQK